MANSISHENNGRRPLDCKVYIDECGICPDGSFDEPLALVDKVFTRFRDNGRKYNPLTKCAMTPEGVKPRQKKMDAVLKMSAPPKNQKEVWACIGGVAILQNYVPSRRNSRWPLEINSNGKSWVKVLSTIHPVLGTKRDSEGSCRDEHFNRIIGNSVIPSKKIRRLWLQKLNPTTCSVYQWLEPSTPRWLR